MWRLSFFGPSFAKFGLRVKKHCRNRYFRGLLSGPSRAYYLVQGWCVLNMANLDQIITPQSFAHNFFFINKCWKHLFLSALTNTVFKKANLDQIITPQKAKLGPDNNSTTYIYIIHIHYLNSILTKWGLLWIHGFWWRAVFILRKRFLNTFKVQISSFKVRISSF